ncbi:hypothetical protein ACFZC5_20450 [Nocardia gamkensis]
MGTASLDDIREPADDFANELRRKNRAEKTIDVYSSTSATSLIT